MNRFQKDLAVEVRKIPSPLSIARFIYKFDNGNFPKLESH